MLPGIAGRERGAFPRQAGDAFGVLPVAHQFGFRLVERAAFARRRGFGDVG